MDAAFDLALPDTRNNTHPKLFRSNFDDGQPFIRENCAIVHRFREALVEAFPEALRASPLRLCGSAHRDFHPPADAVYTLNARFPTSPAAARQLASGRSSASTMKRSCIHCIPGWHQQIMPRRRLSEGL